MQKQKFILEFHQIFINSRQQDLTVKKSVIVMIVKINYNNKIKIKIVKKIHEMYEVWNNLDFIATNLPRQKLWSTLNNSIFSHVVIDNCVKLSIYINFKLFKFFSCSNWQLFKFIKSSHSSKNDNEVFRMEQIISLRANTMIWKGIHRFVMVILQDQSFKKVFLFSILFYLMSSLLF